MGGGWKQEHVGARREKGRSERYLSSSLWRETAALRAASTFLTSAMPLAAALALGLGLALGCHRFRGCGPSKQRRQSGAAGATLAISDAQNLSMVLLHHSCSVNPCSVPPSLRPSVPPSLIPAPEPHTTPPRRLCPPGPCTTCYRAAAGTTA